MVHFMLSYTAYALPILFFFLYNNLFYNNLLYSWNYGGYHPLTGWIHEHCMHISWATLRSNIWFLSFLHPSPVFPPPFFPLFSMEVLLIILWKTDMSNYWYLDTNLITNHPFNGALSMAKATYSPFSCLMLKFAFLVCLACF